MRVLVVRSGLIIWKQVRAAIGLIEAQGGMVAGIAAIHIDANERTQQLRDNYLRFQVCTDA